MNEWKISKLTDIIQYIEISDLPDDIKDAIDEYLEQQDKILVKAHKLIDKLAEILP